MDRVADVLLKGNCNRTTKLLLVICSYRLLREFTSGNVITMIGILVIVNVCLRVDFGRMVKVHELGKRRYELGGAVRRLVVYGYAGLPMRRL